MRGRETILAIDIGNTTVAWGLWRGSDLGSAGALLHRDLEGPLPREWFEAERAGIASVHSPAVERLLARWGDRPPRERRLLRSHRDLPVVAAVPRPEQVGVDRLLNVLAWSRRHPGDAAIILDFGTAITFDLADAAGAYRGGLILPGPELIARSLDRGTELLPEVVITPDLEPYGVDTVGAIVRGVSGLLVGGLDRLIARAREAFDPSARVVATGGGAASWAPLLVEVERILPHLTLEGVRIALEDGAGPSIDG